VSGAGCCFKGKQKLDACLAVILVGDIPRPLSMRGNNVRACEQVGIGSTVTTLPPNVDPATVISRIQELNRDTSVLAVIV
jgi:methylenetetrahydrofolate dehydrogenase (NADP+)/methenyltetrahydrofolate cyclohydrolase